MSWTAPLQNIQPAEIEAKVVRERNSGSPKRAVVIDGVRYPSMATACRMLKCSYKNIYRKIGENWRFGG